MIKLLTKFYGLKNKMLLKVNKPSGYTSYDIVEKIKRLFWNEKVGHSGTLDPMASGLLII
jgi:tRNA pseudouridine55 synthase